MSIRRALVLSLPFLVALDGVPIPVGAVSVRVGQVAACLLVIPLVASVLIGARQLRTDGTVWWLAAILTVNLLASVLHSPVLSYSVMQCASMASVWVLYVLVINFLDTREEVAAFARSVLWAAIAAGALGIAAYVLAIGGLHVPGAETSKSAVEHLTMAYGAYGTMLEPNIFGSFTAAHLVLAIVLLTAIAQHPAAIFASQARVIRIVAAVSALGLVLSFTRAAWLGAVAGVVAGLLLMTRMLSGRVRLWRIATPLGAALVVVVALLLLPGGAGTLFRFKLFNLVNIGSQSVLVRVINYSMALDQVTAHPFIGWGTFTFAPLAAQGSDFQQFENWRNLWIGNYLLLALHDTGIVGLFLWCGLSWSVCARGIRAARAVSATDVGLAAWTLGLTVAVASLLIPFLTTSGFSLGFPWILIGLLGAHCRIAERRRSPLLDGGASASE